MRFHWSHHIFFSLYFILQLNDVGTIKLENEQIPLLQNRVEQLIEKILTYMHDYYDEIKTDVKCIPECVVDTLIESLKTGIKCIKDAENRTRYTQRRTRSKKFLQCLSEAKKEIRDIMETIDPTIDYCPDNITEKTYQINVSTTFTKSFTINIKNGVEVLKNEIELEKDTKQCYDYVSIEEESEETEDEVESDEKHKNTFDTVKIHNSAQEKKKNGARKSEGKEEDKKLEPEVKHDKPENNTKPENNKTTPKTDDKRKEGTKKNNKGTDTVREKQNPIKDKKGKESDNYEYTDYSVAEYSSTEEVGSYSDDVVRRHKRESEPS